jgi:hypothetical protein
MRFLGLGSCRSRMVEPSDLGRLLEAAEQFNSVLRDFLRRHDPDPTAPR